LLTPGKKKTIISLSLSLSFFFFFPIQSNDDFLLEFRRSQLRHRVDEVRETISLLRDLNEGKEVHNLLLDSKDFDLSVFKGRLDMSRLAVTGHSFGVRTFFFFFSLGRAEIHFLCGRAFAKCRHGADDFGFFFVFYC
jgi:hypothetical protein